MTLPATLPTLQLPCKSPAPGARLVTVPEGAGPPAGMGYPRWGGQGHCTAAPSKPRSLPRLVLLALERVPSSSGAGRCQDTCRKILGEYFMGAAGLGGAGAALGGWGGGGVGVGGLSQCTQPAPNKPPLALICTPCKGSPLRAPASQPLPCSPTLHPALPQFPPIPGGGSRDRGDGAGDNLP